MNRDEAASIEGPGTAQAERAQAAYRVMVVDDSAIVRGLLIRALEADPEIEVVSSASNGAMALTALGRQDIEIVILDIEMPVMDGLTALPKLLALKPNVKIIIASTLTRHGADITLRALAAGAVDYLTKPPALTFASSSGDQFRRELLTKVKALGHAGRVAAGRRAPRRRPEAAKRDERRLVFDLPRRRSIPMRPLGEQAPTAIAIGASTGGPQALFRVLGALRGQVRQPIFVTQHMPPTFTTILAEHIGRCAGQPAAEGVDGEPVAPQRVYVAPGDFHMVIDTVGGQKVVRLSKDPPENFCRPSVDPMLRSLAQAYGEGVVSLILTGMGRDGLNGGQAVVAAGGTVVAQDEATSIVWGMPGAVAMAGLCSAVLPLDEIGPFIGKLAARAVR